MISVESNRRPDQADHGVRRNYDQENGLRGCAGPLRRGSRLRDLRVPTRIVWGASDGFQKVRYGERFARDLEAPLVRIEQGKHFTPEDHPEAMANEINRVLEDVRQVEHAGRSAAQPEARR